MRFIQGVTYTLAALSLILGAVSVGWVAYGLIFSPSIEMKYRIAAIACTLMLLAQGLYHGARWVRETIDDIYDQIDASDITGR